jgi:phosphatidylserine decarboxylase
LDEVEHDDLTRYVSLGDFFYRRLKDGARPIAKAILVSPADGTVLHLGTVKDLRVEQVKGLTYSLDALLGVERPGTPPPSAAIIRQQSMPAVDDHEFANVNGIEYSLDQLIGGASSPGTTTPISESPSSSTPSSPTLDGSQTPDSPSSSNQKPTKFGEQVDASVVEPDRDMQETLAHDAGVALEMGVKPSLQRSSSSWHASALKPNHSLFFTVIYLAPGDYHRFHSPAAWVVEKRRHFAGELFSVSPYMAKRLENLFVLNERVALLGRWRSGFFGMIPVGATNVGSIKVNFDEDLRTNRRRPRRRARPPPGTSSEAVYSHASPVLGGQPLTYGQEMGGFALGSTIVLIFEAPDDFEFVVKAGEKVKVGEKLGDLRSANVSHSQSSSTDEGSAKAGLKVKTA